jgi:hypothetical protein
MCIKHVVVTALFCLSCAATAFAQSAAPPPPSKPLTQSLRVNSRMVQVNVIVRDKNGVPVAGLTKGDFTILDQNQPQEISSFALQNNQMTVTSASAQALNMFSNKFVEGTGGASVATVILLDAVNTAPGNFAQAKEQVAKFVEQMKFGDLCSAEIPYAKHSLAESQ